jgi:hypothetical protein
MPNDNNILQNYFASLNKHFDAVSNFNNQTTALLTSDKLVDLFCEDLGKQAFNGMLGKNKPTNIEKLLVIIKKIESDSKSYVDKISSYVVILEKLITFVIKVAE